MIFHSSTMLFVISVVAFPLVERAEDAVCYPRNLYLTRHTEKLVEDGNRDPGLSEAGMRCRHAVVEHF